MQITRRLLSVALLSVLSQPASAQQAIDSAYTAQIRELTPTHPTYKFSTDLVDYLPASATVPTPLKVLGYVPGTIGKLTGVTMLNTYFRAVADASPRARLYSMGMSEEGREMLILAVGNEEDIARIDEYRGYLARLADPRGVSDAERDELVAKAKPVYWVTGSIHSPETGSPEMLMELAYRLAVDEGEHVRAIRAGAITLITPATEVDGRDRMVDTYNYSKANNTGRPMPYWGKYVAHDNNRDGMGLTLALSQAVAKQFIYWRPTVMHDLHESVPFLYTSTGTGPYNPEFDAIQVNEWHLLAFTEMNELTGRGLPGVWTHGFYDGWGSNYMLSYAQLHNSIGKFYETYTASGADCIPSTGIGGQGEQIWYRHNPPVSGVRWCIRSNLNYQQSGVLVALRYVADNRQMFLRNFFLKGQRMVEKGRREGPNAYIIPREQRRAAEAADLINLFRMHAAEIHVATEQFKVKDMPKSAPRGLPGGELDTRAGAEVTVKPGDWIIRMDQPYAAPVRSMLAIQGYKASDPSPYDDTGWTLDYLRNVTTYTVDDSTIFTRKMRLLDEDAVVAGAIAGSGTTLLVPHTGDWRSAVLPWKVAPAAVSVATDSFTVGSTRYPAGTYLLAGASESSRQMISDLGLNAVATSAAISVARHPVTLPRIAYIHTWTSTQDEGWVRLAFDRMGVPYTYMADQKLANTSILDDYDVVIFPHVGGNMLSIMNGRSMNGAPQPYKRTELTPHLGTPDETDDMRPGMGLDGAQGLRRFIERGGLFIAEGNTTNLPVSLAFNPWVSVAPAPTLRARGGVFRAVVTDAQSPIMYGYDAAEFPVHFGNGVLFNNVGGTGGRGGAPGGGGGGRGAGATAGTPDNTMPRTVLRFHSNADSLLVSGLLVNGEEMAGRAAVVHAPVGKGNMVLFGIRPFWRWQTQGVYAMALNAMINWNNLGEPAAPVASNTGAGGAR